MIVVATSDFEVYHGVVNELRDRGTTFTTIEPGDELPAATAVVVTDAESVDSIDGGGGKTGDTGEAGDEQPGADGDVAIVVAEPTDPRRAVEKALATLREAEGRTIVGVDPGRKPGIAVCTGETIVAAFQVPLAECVEVIEREVADATDPVVRIGDGSRLEGARLVNELADVRVELVDETGTTPYLGTGARGMGDVLAAANIARLEGEVVETREIEPTAGEIQVIKDRSREASETNRAIDEVLARRVATGELTVEEALDAHDRGDGSESTAEDDSIDESSG